MGRQVAAEKRPSVPIRIVVGEQPKNQASAGTRNAEVTRLKAQGAWLSTWTLCTCDDPACTHTPVRS